MKKVVIVIPTCNESRSIRETIEGLLGNLPRGPSWQCSLLVVDANSPDGTAEVVRGLARRHPEVHLIVEEKKEGIGAACLKGFRHATGKLCGDVLIEFDGDSQHPPEAIPSLLREIERGSDLVLGSRRRPGGSYPKHWDPLRLFFSRAGGFLARLILFFPSPTFRAITDPTTGLRATKVDGPFGRLDLGAIRSRGFGYKIEMLFHLSRLGARISEIPLQFRSRPGGESKMTRQTPVEILGTALRLRIAYSLSNRGSAPLRSRPPRNS